MAVQIVAPKLGMSVSDVKMVEWKAKEGDWVEKGNVVLVIETEKTEWMVEAGVSGFLHILVQEGVKAKIGQVVGLIAETKEELEKLQKETPREPLTGEARETPLSKPVQPKPGITEIEAGEAGGLSVRATGHPNAGMNFYANIMLMVPAPVDA